MASYTMSALPDLETGTTLEQVNRNLKTVKNWLYQLNEQLRYNLYNIETDNLTEETVDKFTSVSDDVKAELSVLDGKITAAVSASDGRFAALEVSIDGITAQVQDAEGNISQLQQTATSLTSTIQDVEGNVSVLQQTANSLSSTIQDVEGNVSILQQTANSLSSRIVNAEGSISEVEQTADKINWVVAYGTSASNFSLTSHMASLISDEVRIQTDNLEISSISYDTSCYVQCDSSGVYIYTGHGDITLGNPSGDTTLNGNSVYTPTLRPSGSPNCIVGNGNCVIYGQVSGTSWAETSDRTLKSNISDISADEAEIFISALKPSSYYMASPLPSAIQMFNLKETVSATDTPKRYGFIAQDVKAAMEKAGMNSGIVVEMDDGTLALRYTEIIAPLVAVVQKQQSEIDALKEAVGIGKTG